MIERRHLGTNTLRRIFIKTLSPITIRVYKNSAGYMRWIPVRYAGTGGLQLEHKVEPQNFQIKIYLYKSLGWPICFSHFLTTRLTQI